MPFKNIRKLTVTIIPFIIIVVLALTIPDRITEWDLQFSQFIYNLRLPLMDSLFKAVTTLANPGFVVITTIAMILISGFFLKKWKIALTYAVALVLGNLVVNPFIKNIFDRARPDQSNWLVLADSYSFPSGHSFAASMIYPLLVYILMRYTSLSKYSKIIKPLLVVLVIAIGFSRIYVGVHYLSDVIAGLSLGLSCYYLTRYVIEAYIDPLPTTGSQEEF